MWNLVTPPEPKSLILATQLMDYQFYLAWKKTAEMEEVYGVGPKNLQINFRLKELLSARNVSRYFSV